MRQTCRRPISFLFLSLGLVCLSAVAQTPSNFEYIGQQIVPNGFRFGGSTVGGLSAIDYDAAHQRYFALSDDRSSIDPARFYTLKLDLSRFRRNARPGMDGVRFESAIFLRNADGDTFPEKSIDPEGLRYDTARNRIYWSDEGQRGWFTFRSPAVREAEPDGRFVRQFAIPPYYAPSGSTKGNDKGDSGVYDNLAFESLAIAPDGKTVWTALENGLAQDSPQATLEHGSKSRFLSFDIASGKPGAEYVYEVSPVALPPAFPWLYSMNGLADFIMVGDRQFITLERSYAIGAATPDPHHTGVTVRLYYADARTATDVSGIESIAGKPIVEVAKTLLLNLSDLRNDDDTALAVDNLEGITFGPCYQGKPTLILISDNNFSALQFTQIVAIAMNGGVPMPNVCAVETPK